MIYIYIYLRAQENPDALHPITVLAHCFFTALVCFSFEFRQSARFNRGKKNNNNNMKQKRNDTQRISWGGRRKTSIDEDNTDSDDSSFNEIAGAGTTTTTTTKVWTKSPPRLGGKRCSTTTTTKHRNWEEICRQTAAICKPATFLPTASFSSDRTRQDRLGAGWQGANGLVVIEVLAVTMLIPAVSAGNPLWQGSYKY